MIRVDLGAGRDPALGRAWRTTPWPTGGTSPGAGRPRRSPSARAGWTVPDNRWDLLADLRAGEPPSVSVVIPHFEAQRQLDLVLSGLAVQTHPATRLEVVVADDGSRTPPDLAAAGALPIRLVRQPDRGFRAAAARNLGASAASGEVLLFLDGDTVPEPTYVDRLARLPGLVPDLLAVGLVAARRLHRLDHDRVTRWLAGDEPGPDVLAEPAWLRDGYAGTRDLLDADDRSYRFVISAVCAVHRELFAELVDSARSSPSTAVRIGSSPTGPGSPGPCSPTRRPPWPGTTVRTGRSGPGRIRRPRMPRHWP